VRLIRKLRKRGTPSDKDRENINGYLEKITSLLSRFDTLVF
jgi:hypothetical protein